MIPTSQDFQIRLVLPPFSKITMHSLGFCSLSSSSPVPTRALALRHDNLTTVLRYTSSSSSSTATSLATQDITVTMPIWMKGLRKIYANLSEEFGNIENLAYGQVYMRGHIIYCPHFNDVEVIGLEEEVDFDEVIQVLTGDSGAIWPETNRLNLNLLKMPYRALFRLFCGCWLSSTNVTALLKEMTHLLHTFSTRKRINLFTVMLRNILRKIDQKKASKIALPSPCLISKYILGCRDLSLPTDSWLRELYPLVMPKITTHRIEVVIQFNGVEELKGFKIKQLVLMGSLEELKGFNCAVYSCTVLNAISRLLYGCGPTDVRLAELYYQLLCLVLNHTNPHTTKSATLHE
ncbi:hypothetical protein M9H77_22718 [Catharanthus roseus]|uniref:Uncharacterized protein n=1 Tax=Catharanthus roseus TaxID=4058 RepID=A0ACC0ASZ3_CATRO|nr:hypothetical protein M9H77_22718 [Catharanthus roseus]